MVPSIRSLLGRAGEQVAADLRADPYLRYILLGSALLASFWFWHLIPNFATRDEKSRLFDPLVTFGMVLSEPGFESLREGVLWSRVPFGATFYLFGLAALPVIVVAALTGQLDVFAELAPPAWDFGFYPAWAGTPRWVWTWSLVFVRLFNVLFAVGCVYLAYRIGVAARDRMTGRLSALLLSLTFGFLTIAHEGGEDMPATFFVLVALYLVVRYVQDGERSLFYAASAAGGVAIAFKLTAAPVVVVIAAGFLLRADREDGPLWKTLVRPRLVGGGALLGLVAIVLGFPTLLVGGVDPFLDRVFGHSAARMDHPTGPDAPTWWWFLRGYFSALGLPLFVASVGGVVASVFHVRRSDRGRDAIMLVLVALAAYVLMFSEWHDFRVHHLLPTFPLLAVLLAVSVERFRAWNPSIAGPLIAFLVVTTAVYAAAGTAGYASMPRDEATSWLRSNADEDATMEVYRINFQDAAVPHGMSIAHMYGPRTNDGASSPCPEYVQIGYRDLLYLVEGSYYRNGEAQAVYVRSLLDGEYGYEIVAEFGPRPPDFVPDRPEPGSLVDLLRLGVIPQTDQFADEQELAENQYTVILEHTGECDENRNPPF